jgi:hypothetical protein
MVVTISKKDGVLSLYDHGGFQSRNTSIMWCVREADKRFGWPDFAPFNVCSDDRELGPDHYSFSKQNSYRRLIPDFNYHAWPQVGVMDYAATIKEIDTAGRLDPLLQKVGWIGNTDTCPTRKVLCKIGAENPNLFDTFSMKWLEGSIPFGGTKFISMQDLAKTYAALLDIEGAGYSGRLKHLLWSHRPLLLVDRPHWEFFFEFLKPWEHYVPVARDLSDLVEKAKWVFDNYEEAKRIGERAYAFAQEYLTQEAAFKKWDEIVRSHAGA